LLDTVDAKYEAIDAYQSLLAVAPRLQMAATGIAAALLRSGRTAEAVAAAEQASHLTDEPEPFVAAFNRGDFRFVQAWLDEIRRLRR
jgi:hypothetical protein